MCIFVLKFILINMRIKEILKEKNMTVQELADKMNVSRQALSRQINGKLLVETAQNIADALEVPLWQLFKDGEEDTPSAPSVTCPYCGHELKINVE